MNAGAAPTAARVLAERVGSHLRSQGWSVDLAPVQRTGDDALVTTGTRLFASREHLALALSVCGEDPAVVRLHLRDGSSIDVHPSVGGRQVVEVATAAGGEALDNRLVASAVEVSARVAAMTGGNRGELARACARVLARFEPSAQDLRAAAEAASVVAAGAPLSWAREPAARQ